MRSDRAAMTLLAPLTFVTALLFTCGPSAISWLIVAVIVGIPVKSGSFRPRPHVSQESKKVFAPLFAHRYAAAAVIRITDVPWLIAPVLCSTPGRVLRRVFKAMFKKCIVRLCGSMESASLCSALHKMGALHNSFLSAIAHAGPPRLSVAGPDGMQRDDYEFSESLAGQIVNIGRPVAAATSSLTEDQKCPSDSSGLTALTKAFPLSILRFMNPGVLNNCKASKCSPGNVFEVVSVLGRLLFSHAAHPPLVSGWLEPFRCANTGRLALLCHV